MTILGNGSRALLALYLVLMPMIASAANLPTSNPLVPPAPEVEGYPAWSDAIRWSKVLDMSAYPRGKTAFERFENARDELAADGGGVLYYPAGDYDFTQGPFDGPTGRGLMLKTGIVIRGEAPAGSCCAGRDGRLELGTRFRFGFQQRGGGQVPRDWNLIGLSPTAGEHGDDRGIGVRFTDNVGICWVHLIGAVICFGPDFTWSGTWGTARSWRGPFVKPSWAGRRPDGTHPLDAFMAGPIDPRPGWPRDPDGSCYNRTPEDRPDGRFLGSGRGRIVFGCVLEDACLLNDFDTCGRPDPPTGEHWVEGVHVHAKECGTIVPGLTPAGFGHDGFHMARYAARIAVYGSRILVANNLLPESRACFAYPQTTVVSSGCDDLKGKGNRGYRYRERRQSQVLFDYNRVTGIDVNKSLLACVPGGLIGDPAPRGYFAEGVVVRDNWVFNHGNKGFDISGQWVTIQGNRNERAFLRGGEPYHGADGWRLTLDGFVESQSCADGNISDNYSRAFDLAGHQLWIDNNSYGNLGSEPGNDGEAICCQLHNGTHWHGWAVTRNRLEATPKGGSIYAYGINTLGALIAWNQTAGIGVVGGPNWRRADIALIANLSHLRACPEALLWPAPGLPNTAVDFRTKPNYDGDAVIIDWTDTANNEIGFRVERQIGGGPWMIIAYRPPRIQGAEENPQRWVDFLAPSGVPLRYRVTAINAQCEGVPTADSAPVTLSQPQMNTP